MTRAGKNIINIIAWASILETHPDKLHLAAGVSVATAKLNIIDSNGFGLLNYFKGRCREGKYKDKDALFIQTATGEKIVLISGGGKNGDERLIKGFTLGTVYISEANECAQPFIQEVFDRTISSGQRKILFDLNPKAELHWFYTEVLAQHEENVLHIPQYGYNYEHFTIFDNLSMSDDRIRTIIQTYDQKSIWYLRDILGLRKNAEGVIYDMFCTDNMYDDDDSAPIHWNLLYRRYYAIDYGTINPFACLECIEQTVGRKTVYVVNSEYYYDSKKERKQLTDAEYTQRLQTYVDHKRYVFFIVDPSAASFKLELRKGQLNSHEAADTINADNEVLNGIRLVATLLQAKKLYINKNKCPNLCRELQSYIWDEKASERGVEKPVKENDHGCITGDTLIDTTQGSIPIKDLINKRCNVYCFDGKTKKKTISNAFNIRMTKKKAEIYEVKLEDGRIIHATDDHPILTQRGWVELRNILPGDCVLSIK
ncbi:PBSX family phage terminase large subunit [Megasphaera cerevisiae]|uniref:PBSX family phage terminase large subunit n=1 Tax=Megasphaera cerevisiae TaxID=39029 RepID=UPI00069E6B79|nr:PBSX family phage terminase large subunit [Megasphaera cerevisiae]SJZ58978.1 phage terminase, large subunit, PBSX family [Megasphaera cerevisiae DSM 20462]